MPGTQAKSVAQDCRVAQNDIGQRHPGDLARTDTEKNNFDSLQEHHQVEDQAVMLDVIQVVLQFLLRIASRRAVRVRIGPIP